MKLLRIICSFSYGPRSSLFCHKRLVGSRRMLSVASDHSAMPEFMDYLDSLKNYEKSGVPKDAGTDSDDGFDLGRMRRLLGRLGNPHSRFKAVHIAGTKGKGSTAAFLANILQAEGYSVGCYTSPHILTIRERISVGKYGGPVPADRLNRLFREIKTILDESIRTENGHLSHFEVFTSMAFTVFAEESVDIAIIEAGLGGARDATNVIYGSELVASIITSIGEEHLDALGGSLESIAVAKSGIIKQGRPVVLGGPFLPKIERILREKALAMNSPVLSASDASTRTSIKRVEVVNGRLYQLCDMVFHVHGDSQPDVELLDLKMSMLGRHQLQNAATATCAVLCLRDSGWIVSDSSIRIGLEQTYMLGRNQLLTSSQASALGLNAVTVLLDGAHTKDSAKALVDTIRLTLSNPAVALVVAMAMDKDHVAFAKEFLSGTRVEAVFLTEVSIAGASSRSTSSTLLRDRWIHASEELGISVLHDGKPEYSEAVMNDDRVVIVSNSSFANSVQAAYQILKRRAGNKRAVLVITGSLHVVSSVLHCLDN
ncbi:hypothetical protein MLD38_015684 [Melastoma candidum]|uniref:Uncharacterized protein n=1 Tax=Melastoma candidum TaxID=119954 RepID=A0ACB9RGT8_9MYRT|nr:hypothetical protein MLD38_015684 [Melastoma candidum]